MKQKLEKILPKSEFARNVLTLMTGTTIAQAIPIAISPILTRLYTPEDFGILALFVAIISVFGSIANGRYELAVMLPKKDSDAINILALGLLIVTTLSTLLLIVVVFFHSSIVELIGEQKIDYWLYFIPITVFFIGVFNMLNYFNNRKQCYKNIAKATVVKSVVLSAIQLFLGLLKLGASGLVSGQIFSQFSGNIQLGKNILRDKSILSNISMVKIKQMARRYKRFPQYDLWSVLFNVSATQAVVLLIADFFSLGVIGFYSFSFKIITRPSALIGTSIGQVFYQSSSSVKDDPDKFRGIVLNTYKRLLQIGIIPFSLLAFYSDYIFGFVFGVKWIEAGEYAQILSPWLFIAFIASPLSTVLLSYDKQDVLLKINLTLFVFRVLSVIVGGLIFKNIVITLILLCVVGVLVYSSLILYVFSLTKIRVKNVLLYSYKFLIVVFCLGGVRYLMNLWS